MGKSGRGVSAGTVLMLILAAVVVASYAALFPVLWSEGDPTATQQAATVRAAATESVPQEIRLTNPQTPTPAPTAAVGAPVPGGSFTLTAGGTVAVEKTVRQSGYFSSAKKYDYDEVFSLLAGDLAGDISLVTLENLVVPGKSMSTLVVPPEVMRMLTVSGVNTVSLGFPSAWEYNTAGMATTLDAAEAAGLRALGAFTDEASAAPASAIREVNGVRVAMLHFTMNPSAKSKKAIKQDGHASLYPLTDRAAEDIAAARAAGAQVVIVSVHWGKRDASAPAAAQKTLAQEMVAAGADLILGSGARNVQPVEWITVPRADGTERKALCAWCLGNLLSESRGNNAVAGMLLPCTVTVDERGAAEIGEITYTPTFIWRFSLDGVTNYRVIPAAGATPDGLDRDQTKARTNAADRVAKKLGSSPVRLAE